METPDILMKEALDSKPLEIEALEAVNTASSTSALEELRVQYLGKKGLITEQLKALGKASPEERQEKGKQLNLLKKSINDAIQTRKETLERGELNASLANETIDLSLPARQERLGAIHPITKVIQEVTELFAQYGFAVADGPEIESDFHNFTALNIPPEHPARQMHDTFYLEAKDEKGDALVLRTHTSPVQIRTMMSGEPPFRVIAPGRTYRCDSDMTHTPMFHQVEGLVIEKGIHFGHLKGIVTEFIEAFFGIKDVPVRFRPSFFPFTEPSAEVDIGCEHTKDGLVIGGNEGWMEIMGCGMVHPNVLRNCDIDPNEWLGFAFGAGIERLAMLKYNIPDLRTFFESDLRWLEHYGFNQ